ncbi:MAG TPA: MATE family efflux transporter, partial [Armatimonadota bacterium]|nr:MATE family efflux transporter [Armatimonadota bacterium]
SVIPLVVLYLQINAIAQPTQGIGFVLKGALQGAGDTRIPMLISLIANWIIRLPLAYLFAITLDLGAMGAWIAMSISASLNGVLSAIWFKWGTWRTLEV